MSLEQDPFEESRRTLIRTLLSDINNTTIISDVFKKYPELMYEKVVGAKIPLLYVDYKTCGVDNDDEGDGLFLKYVRLYKKHGMTLKTKIYKGMNIIEYVHDKYPGSTIDQDIRNIFIIPVPSAGF